ncbi:MAG: trypsin-like peptidase domain-containing protein, partial [Nocardioides sp.]
DAAPASVVDDPDIVASAKSVFQVYAEHDVMTAFEGTAFPIAPDRFMTAAHVVRDSDSIAVVNHKGERVPAEIVVCDPDHDVAVLAAPGVDATVLAFGTAEADDVAAVVGFPDDGPLTFSPARVRQRLDWQSSDIYGNGRYTHDAYQVRGKIRGGNSGGPMFAEDGSVLGVVVAWSRADPDTGYVLTSDQVSDAVDRGTSGAPGSADDCRSG